MIHVSALRVMLLFFFANTVVQEKILASSFFDRFLNFFKQHEQKEPTERLQDLEQQLIDDPKNPHLNYNLGVALYRLEKFNEAKHNFERAALHGEKALFKEKAYFNFANCLYKNTLSMLPDNWEDSKQKVEPTILQAAIAEVANSIKQYDSVLAISEKNQKALSNKKEAEKLLQKLQEKMKQQQEQDQQKNNDQEKKQDKNDNQQQDKNNQKDKNQSSEQDKKDNNQDKQSNNDQSKNEQSKSDKNNSEDQGKQSSNNNQQQKDQNHDKQDKNQSSKNEQSQDDAHKKENEKKSEHNQQQGQDQREKDHEQEGREKDPAKNQNERKDSGKDQPERENASQDKQNNMSHDNREQQKDHQKKPTQAESTETENQKQENGKGQPADAEMQHQEDSTQKRAYRALLDNLDTAESKLQKQLIMQETKGHQVPAGNTQKPW